MLRIKTKLFIVLFLLFAGSVFAQQKVEVRYEYTQAQGLVLQYQLSSTESFSQFRELPRDFIDSNALIENEDSNQKGSEAIDLGIKAPINIKSRLNFFNIDLKTAKTDQVVEISNGNLNFITDTPPKLEWKITDEFKTIGEFSAIKATTSFRGRDFEVWFTPEIPISAGPWKLHGLSGLILEARDVEGHHIWLAKSLKYPADFEEEIFKVDLGEIKTTYTFQEAVKVEREYIKRQERIHQSRITAQGFKEEIISSGEDYRLERVFEWE